jgi:putative ABC transport system permease protein
MAEAIVMTAVAAIIGAIILELAAPWLGVTFGIQLQEILNTFPNNLITIASMTLIVGTLAGIYPSILLSAFRPANHLGGGRSEVASTIRTRSILVVFQFAASIALIICTTIIYQQTKFARSVDLGFDKSGVVVLNRLTRESVGPALETFIDELRRRPGTIAVAPAEHVPGDDSEGNVGVRLPSEDVTAERTLSWQDVGYDYYSALSILPLAGRIFSRDFPGDELLVRDEVQGHESGGAILNVSAAKLLGFNKPEDAIGKRLIIGDGMDLDVVGVVPDIRYRSVRQAVRPSIHMLELDPLSSLLVKYSADDPTAYLDELNRLWQQLVPGAVLQLEHLDQKLDALYGSEDRWADMFLASSLLAVFISALGLYGLTAFAVERRALEVAIRKVLGAKVGQIVRLFSWQFTKPLAVANLIAWPLAWVFMSEWLGNFSIRIDLNAWPFLLAAAFVFVVAWLTIATGSYRIARERPARTLGHQ